MPGNCLTNCFTSRFKSLTSPTLCVETVSYTASNIGAADEIDAAKPLSPPLETPSTGPVVQHAEQGTESPLFESVPQPLIPPVLPASSLPGAHVRPLVPGPVPVGNLVSTLDGAGEYNGDFSLPLSAITELSEPLPNAAIEGGIRGGYLPSSFVMSPTPAPPTPPLPPPPPVPPAHPRPPVPEIVPAASPVPTLDAPGETYKTDPIRPSAIAEASESLPSEETGSSIRGGYLSSAKELHPPPCPSSRPPFQPPILARSIYNCSKCRQPTKIGGLLSRHIHECIEPEMASRPFQCFKCHQTSGRDNLLGLLSKKCFGNGGAPINAKYFRSQPNIARRPREIGRNEGKGLGKDDRGRTTPAETIVLPRAVGLDHVQEKARREHEKKRGHDVISSSAGSAVEPKAPRSANILLPSKSFRQASSSSTAFMPGNLVIPLSQLGSSVRPSEPASVARSVGIAAFYRELPNDSSNVLTAIDDNPFRPERRRQLCSVDKSNLITSQIKPPCSASYLHMPPLAVLSGWEGFMAARGCASISAIEYSEDKISEEDKVLELIYSLNQDSEWRLNMAEGVGQNGPGSYYKEAVEVQLLLPGGSEILSCKRCGA